MSDDAHVARLEQAIIDLLRLLDARFGAIDERFTRLDQRLDQIDRRIDRLEDNQRGDFRWLLTLLIGIYVGGAGAFGYMFVLLMRLKGAT